jgi:hypothetical protein
VHFTKRIDGEVWAGPNAVLAFAREGYRRRDISLRDLAGVLTDRGFLRLATRFWRTGAAEMWRDVSKRAFLADMRRYVPEVRSDQIVFGPSGVRAQALDPNGTLVMTLVGRLAPCSTSERSSPAATASLAIAASSPTDDNASSCSQRLSRPGRARAPPGHFVPNARPTSVRHPDATCAVTDVAVSVVRSVGSARFAKCPQPGPFVTTSCRALVGCIW